MGTRPWSSLWRQAAPTPLPVLPASLEATGSSLRISQSTYPQQELAPGLQLISDLVISCDRPAAHSLPSMPQTPSNFTPL